ncbi:MULTISPECIES: iron-containing alcohol dehydrogenase [unclassified Rathayibacter]|uniref:iron-containing alcohol dehydrogenase n=1 Tax=unclassified Rathayibacter TaxID=2609250 RepID=UPI00188CCC7A|nr:MULTISPECIES: iron-containing alcohol dehydrogenase [unclassified Rathayibacter]MBF4461831.1 iron-containing alcohol dehydrogenase [Rathayibacter sp. VKM Ac-2879]MBF4503244.1 iron-containing alcohol dehydrogenase [Rathayibacter sp. VKM Ac-2878]
MSAAALWCPTRIIAGRGITAGVLAELPRGDRSLVVVDERLVGRVDPVGGAVALEARAELSVLERLVDRIDGQRPEVVVALGGGSILDLVKLAVAVPPERWRGFSRRLEGGLVLTRRPLREAAPRVVAVPTTIGTASEVSPVACVTARGGHRLVVGDDLRPHTAVVDPEHLDSLSARAVGEGALEALLRVAGTAASGSLSPFAVDRAVDLGRRIVAAGDAALLDGAGEARGTLALVSAETRYSWSAHPADAFAARHWYPANELAHAASIGKMAATLFVLPRLWRLLLGGDARLGSAEALRRFWRGVRPDAATRPDRDVLTLAARWGIPSPPALDASTLERAAAATRHVWTGTGAALAGWDTELTAAVVGTRQPPSGHGAAPVASTEQTAEEVNTWTRTA